MKVTIEKVEVKLSLVCFLFSGPVAVGVEKTLKRKQSQTADAIRVRAYKARKKRELLASLEASASVTLATE